MCGCGCSFVLLVYVHVRSVYADHGATFERAGEEIAGHQGRARHLPNTRGNDANAGVFSAPGWRMFYFT